MANGYNITNSLLKVFLFMALFTLNTYADVFEVNSKNLDKFLKGKFFTLTFVDSPSCTRCRIQFPFFVQASQVFEGDPEIFLARTHDKNLIKDWGVTELPALIYHTEGVNGLREPQLLPIDVTVDDIVDTIARLLHGNFAGLKRTYTVQLTEKNYQELIITPKQHTLILIHDKKDKQEIENMERVAYAFRKDDPILIASLDVKKQMKLRDDKFMTRETPVLMWFDADGSKPKRFGGILSAELVTMFVNEKTGLNRDTEGGILEEAGRVEEADELIEASVEDVYDVAEEKLVSLAAAITALKVKMDLHHVDLLDFYLFVLDNIVSSGTISTIRDMHRDTEEKLMEREELSTKERETHKRRRNVLAYLQNLMNEVRASRKAKEKLTKEKVSKADKKKVKDEL